ncbi:Phosphatidylinositol N-acetylglucosaminyltransferase subunit gpi15-like protein [Elsinoe fawcettii]|nr:Phosphatidylinositol N-acetylglucosaminyltransferase subunit gpi15-like protein [Elsinoe fawcettii]
MLTVKRPTSSTVLYTVSTRPPATTLSTKAQRLFRGVLRITVAAFILVTLFCKLHLSHSAVRNLDNPFQHTFPDILASALQWRWLIPISLMFLYLCVRKGYTEESLLVIRGLGVQTSTSSPTYLSTASTRFIPTSSIQDIFLHEAFKDFEVKFYLSIVVENEEDLVVVFPTVFPKRQLLEEVWRGSKACLYEPK